MEQFDVLRCVLMPPAQCVELPGGERKELLTGELEVMDGDCPEVKPEVVFA